MADTMHKQFVTAYADMTNPRKNANNPAFRSKYANLEEVLNVTRPLLAACGFALVQEPVSEDGRIGVHTQLIHESGDTLDFGSYTVPLAKHDAQGAGSAITYCRRYAVASIFGLAQEDDDGNAASKPQVRHSSKPQPEVDANTRPTPEAVHAEKVAYAKSKEESEAIKHQWASVVASYKEHGTQDKVIDALGNPHTADEAIAAFAKMTMAERAALSLTAMGATEVAS